MMIDYNEVDFLVDLHTETDLGEWRPPVGWQFGFFGIKSSVSTGGIEIAFITPVCRIIMEGSLREKIAFS